MSEKYRAEIQNSGIYRSAMGKSGHCIDQLIERITRLCPLSNRTSRIVDEIVENSSSIDRVARLAERDPILANETIRIAKKLDYTLWDDIRTIYDAIYVIELDEIPYILKAVAIISAYRSEQELSQFFYTSMMGSAAMARKLAVQFQGMTRNKAFLCGLLSEVGAMACIKVDGFGYPRLWKKTGGLPVRRSQLETEEYGGSSYDLAERLLVLHHFSEDVCKTVGAGVSRVKELDLLSRIIVFSRTLVPELTRAIREGHYNNFIRNLPKLAGYFKLDLDKHCLMAACQEALPDQTRLRLAI